MISVEGTLSRVVASCTTLGDAVIVLTIDTGKSWPFEVRHCLGRTPEAQVEMHRLASELQKFGARLCHVSAERMLPRTDHGVATYVLHDVQSLRCGSTVLR